MPTPDQTPVIDMNVTPVQTSAQEQYEEFLFRMMTFLNGTNPANANGAWSVVASSNGVIATLGNNWTTAADIVSAAAGVAHSWALLQSPVTLLAGGSKFVQLLIDCSFNTFESAHFVWANDSDPFSTAGLSILNSPSNPAESIENQAIDQQFLENTVLDPHTLHLSRTERGDFFLMCSEDLTTRMEWGVFCAELSGGDVPDAYKVVVGNLRRTSGDGVLTAAQWGNTGTTNPRGWQPNGNASNGNMRMGQTKLAGIDPAYTAAGSAISGRMPAWPMDFYWSEAVAAYRGRFPNMLSLLPPTANINNTDDGTVDAFQWLAFGDFWLLVPNGTVLTNP